MNQLAIDIEPPESRLPGTGSEYAQLLRKVKTAGLLDRRPGHYVIRITATIIAFAAAWTSFALIGRSWWQLVVAAVLAIVFTQIGFLGHDAGHRQIFRSRRANDLAGTIYANLLIGLSYDWWIDKHNRHHAHPNQEGHDPDIDVEPLSFTAAQARRRRGLGRILLRWQAQLFFPLLPLESLSLRAQSVRAVFQSHTRNRTVEAALLLIHGVGYLTAVFVMLSPLQALAFIAVHQGLFGIYLGISFAPNHKGMPILPADAKVDYLRRQVLTSRNVRGGWLIDTVMGGPNYQIEHHLFPSMPRPNLRHAQDMIRTFCREHGVEYAEATVWQSWAQILRYLHFIGTQHA